MKSSLEAHHIVDNDVVVLAVAVIVLDKLRFEANRAGQSDRSDQSDRQIR
jgi:hypothetical protein